MLRIGVLAVLASACSTGDEVTSIANTVDACAPLALVANAPTPLQQGGIDGAYALWRDAAPALGRRAGATMSIVFEDAAAAFHGLYDDREGVIYVNRAIENEAVLSIVIAHELGHAFGLPHVTDRPSVMNPGNLDTPPNAMDHRAVQALWGTCL